MTMGLSLSAYIDVPYFLRSPTGVETASLLGLNTTLAGTNNAAATTVQVASSTSWAAGLAWVLDGPTSEVVTITGSADGTHVTIAAPGLAYAHNAGVSLSQAGSSGQSLAEVILRASAWCDNYCQQGASGSDRTLWALSRVERWGMPSTRAYISRDNVITVRPGHFPVQSVSALTVEFGQGQSVSLDTTSLELMAPARLVEIPYLLLGGPTVGQQLLLETKGLSRAQREWAVLTYTAGITVGAVPWDIQQAVVWVVSDMLSWRLNPTGASEVQMGKRRVVQRQRGDLVGDSLLLLRAHDVLDAYREEVFA
jgi:hypothetical protein